MMSLFRRKKASQKTNRSRSLSWKPRLEALEDRMLLSGLISYYPLENNALDPVGGRNGTLLGDATFSSNVPSALAGFSTRSLSLDGSLDKLIYDVTGADSVAGTFTVALWVNPSQLTAGSASTFFGTRFPNDFGFDVKFLSTDRIRTDIGNGSQWLAIHDTPAQSISVGTWYHVAVTVTPTTGTVYFNGSAVSSISYGPATPILLNANNDLAIGGVGAGVTSEDFHGLIDDVRIFNSSLSAAEIRDIAQGAGPFVVTNTNDSGPGSLRDALTYANSRLGTDTITFNIPGPGVKTINVVSALPVITDPVVIDGYSQPGTRANSLAVGNNAVLLIELNGSGAGTANAHGLAISANNTTVKGLVINRFALHGIALSGNNNVIVGNFIGTNSMGTVDLGNRLSGIMLGNGNDNIIGGTNPAARNLISGNDNYGVLIGNFDFLARRNNVVQGNYIGTNASGAGPLGNYWSGVKILNSNANFVGGNSPGADNLIAANEAGVGLDQANNNVVQGNFIGTNATGDAAPGMGNGYGVTVANNGSGNLILSNRIAFNLGHGVFVESGTGNAISRNSIHSNGGKGIEYPDGPAFPVLTAVNVLDTSTAVEGYVTGPASTTVVVELFSNTEADPSGFGEGRTYLGSVNVTLDSSGNGSFGTVLEGAVPLGHCISATATLADNSTSEFSNCQIVVAYAPTNVESVVVNDGSEQRSRVNSLTVTFSAIVTLDAGAFELRRADGSLVGVNVVTAVVGGKTLVTLTFSGADVIAGSLADGTYQLTIRADRVHDALGGELDGDGDGVGGGNRLDAFFRLFGDTDGNGCVDDVDRAVLDWAFASVQGDATYLWYLDFGGDGDVDLIDRDAFQQRYGTCLHP